MTQQIRYTQRLETLQQMQAQPLEQKIDNTRMLLLHALKEHKRPAIAWSGGKDSTALLHMALKLKPNIDVVWVNTGVEFPECVHFISELKTIWNINLHIAHPKTTFWKVVDEFGWPMLGKGGDGGWRSRAAYLERRGKVRLAKATREAKISAACCRLLKKNPGEMLYRQLQIDCLILGNMVAESRQRFLTWAQKGEFFFAISERRYKVWPLAAWSDGEVWEYHNRFGINHSAIYDKGHKRNGCWPCLMDIRFSDSKLSLLRQSHPKLWRFLLVEKGLAERILTLKLVLEDKELPDKQDLLRNQARNLIDHRPCFFDSC